MAGGSREVEAVVMPAASFWKGKRVLLTGHTGFKGAWTAVWLQRLGAVVTGMSLKPSTVPSLWEEVGSPADNGFVDIRDATAVTKVMVGAQPQIVIHMAAQALVQPSYTDPVETFQTNLIGLVHVLEAARKCATVKAIVNVTSDKCYENREQIWAYREDDRMGGSDPYSASKGCAELITASYRTSFFSHADGPQLGSGRAGNVVGGGDRSAYRLVPDCLAAFGRGDKVVVRNPLATRPWQHVLEPIAGYLILAQALYEKGAPFAEGWNFGPADTDTYSVQHVVERLAHFWGDNAGWSQDDQAYPKEALLLRVDAAKSRLRLGWRPHLSIDETLKWTVDWHRDVARGRSAFDVTSSQIEMYENKASALR